MLFLCYNDVAAGQKDLSTGRDYKDGEVSTSGGPMKGSHVVSMTRDAYAKEVLKVAEAAFGRDEAVVCPHEDCHERLTVVRQSTYSTRALFCPIHGSIFKEQEPAPFGKLDWESHANDHEKINEADWEGDEEEEEIARN